MAKQEEEWKAGTRIDMGKGKYFVASGEKGTGTIYGASGSVIQSNVKGFQRSDGENGGSVFSYTTDTGSQRTDRYDANGARLGSTNTFKTSGGNVGTTEVGKSEHHPEFQQNPDGFGPGSTSVSSTFTLRGRDGNVLKQGERTVGTYDNGERFQLHADTTPGVIRPAPPSGSGNVTKPAGTRETYNLREGVGLLRDSQGRAIGVGGTKDRILTDSEIGRGITLITNDNNNLFKKNLGRPDVFVIGLGASGKGTPLSKSGFGVVNGKTAQGSGNGKSAGTRSFGNEATDGQATVEDRRNAAIAASFQSGFGNNAAKLAAARKAGEEFDERKRKTRRAAAKGGSARTLPVSRSEDRFLDDLIGEMEV